MPRGHPKGKRWTTPEARFWKWVEKTETCWIWTGTRNGFGHGQIRIDGRNVLVHRLSWELHYDPIPPGMCVLHRCDNPPCIRPDHLFLGTKADNTADALQKKRLVYGEATCTAILTEVQVLEIRRRAAQTPRPANRALGTEYGVHPGTISAVVRRINWKHLP